MLFLLGTDKVFLLQIMKIARKHANITYMYNHDANRFNASPYQTKPFLVSVTY